MVGVGDGKRLEHAIRTLVTPLEHEDVDVWRRAVNAALKPLVGADMSTFQFPGEGTEDLLSDEVATADLREYLPLLEKLQRRLWGDPRALFDRVVALRVCDRAALYGRDIDRYLRSEYYNEYIRRHRAFDAMILAVPLPDGRRPAQIYLHHNRPSGGTFPAPAQATLRLLHPALEAGVRAHLTFRAHRGRLETALDALAEATLLLDLDGKVLHRNPAASTLLDADPQGARATARAGEVARSLGSLALGRAGSGEGDGAGPSRSVRTALASYRLRGTLLNGGPQRPFVLVTIRARGVGVAEAAALPTPAPLRERFGLTDRQTQVALLLARRLTNRELADALSISPHTARHHTEVVMRKLGVPSRRGVRRKLLEPLSPASDPPAPDSAAQEWRS